MLIRAIRAENFMRFSRLVLENLPAEGVIGIEGPNESGKTTLGEVLLFALFGKTRLLVDSPVATLIRWGAESMRVEVEFSIHPVGWAPGGHESDASGHAEPSAGGDEPHGDEFAGDYMIYRQVDRCGTHHVKVVRLPDRREVAAGNVRVSDFLARAIRFDAIEFQRSFYHDQYEVRRVETAQVAFFESATGIRQIDEASELLRRELEPLEREFSYYQKEIARNRSQVERYDRNVVKLVDLTERRSKLEESLQEKRQEIAAMRSRIEALRRELGLLDGRAERAGRLQDLALEELLKSVRDLRGDEESSLRPRDELGDDRLRAPSRAILAGLESLESIARSFQDLRRRVSDEKSVLGSQEEGLGYRERHLDAAARRARRVARFLAFASLPILLLAALGVGWLAHFATVHGLSADFRAAYGLPADLPEVLRQREAAWLGGVSGVLVFLLLLVFGGAFRAASRRRRLAADAGALAGERARLRAEAARLEALLSSQLLSDFPALVAEAQSLENPRVAAAARSILDEHGESVSQEKVAELWDRIAAGYESLRSTFAGEVPKGEKRLGEEDGARKRLQSDMGRLESEIRECQSQAAKKEALEEKNRELEASADAILADIEARRLAIALLEETALTLRTKLGPTLTRFVKGALPRLTAGRYRDVRVEEDLEIKVYSSEKNDFLSIHELSGGTNEALSLALRLAVSQALVSTRTRQGQFVLLDEPFKMMDAERAMETLGVLRDLSPDIRQFFVIQPHFDETAREVFSCRILTSRRESDLEVRCR